MKMTSNMLSLILLCLCFSGQSSAADKILLKVPYAFNPKLPNVSSTARVLEEELPALSGNGIKVKIYAPGKLVPPFEILDAVSTGKVNAGFGTSGYWAGKIPASPLFSSVPFGPNAGEYAAWYYKGDGINLHQEMYDQAGYNVKAMVCGVMSPASGGWYANPIDKVDDFKGLKIRSFGLGARVLEKLGATPTLLPAAEIYPALEKGAIDAVEIANPAIEKMLGFHKIVKYNYYPGWQKQSLLFEFMINKDVWNGMDKTHQKAVEVACKSAFVDALAEGEGNQFVALNEYKDGGDVNIVQFSPEIITALENAWEEVAEEESSKDEFFKKAYDNLATFRKNYEVWRINGFL